MITEFELRNKIENAAINFCKKCNVAQKDIERVSTDYVERSVNFKVNHVAKPYRGIKQALIITTFTKKCLIITESLLTGHIDIFTSLPVDYPDSDNQVERSVDKEDVYCLLDHEGYSSKNLKISKLLNSNTFNLSLFSKSDSVSSFIKEYISEYIIMKNDFKKSSRDFRSYYGNIRAVEYVLRKHFFYDVSFRLKSFMDLLERQDARKILNQSRVHFASFYNFLIVNPNRIQFFSEYPSAVSLMVGLTSDWFKTHSHSYIKTGINETSLLDAIDNQQPVSKMLLSYYKDRGYLEKITYKEVSYVLRKFTQRTGITLGLNESTKIGLLSETTKDYYPRSAKDWKYFAELFPVIKNIQDTLNHKDLKILLKGLDIPKKGWYNTFKDFNNVKNHLNDLNRDYLYEVKKYKDSEKLYKKLRTYNIKSLLKHSEDWHLKLLDVRAEVKEKYSKKPEELVPHYEIPEIDIPMEIKKLSTRDDFHQEGSEMKHCVAGYHGRCVEGRSLIFSLKSDYDRTTLEISLVEDEKTEKIKATINQHRGEHNRGIESYHKSYAFALCKLMNKDQESLKRIVKQGRYNFLHRSDNTERKEISNKMTEYIKNYLF